MRNCGPDLQLLDKSRCGGLLSVITNLDYELSFALLLLLFLVITKNTNCSS
jgi:hypothetical protein